MKKILLFVITLLTLTINVMSFKTEAYGYLDYIHEYQIKVDPREDGTLDMQVYLKWEVLDSTSEGPLSWIRVGVPNCYVDEFRPLSSSIKKIKYMYDSGSSVIRVDLRENYYKGDINLSDYLDYVEIPVFAQDEFNKYILEEKRIERLNK